ncbi:MAG: hypothetical protein D6801_09255 [Alphaproteobacteria bacterium]|nr:MAG: hypothetical protein D6801_09255 [Alphaproteobacteria bacterium]
MVPSALTRPGIASRACRRKEGASADRSKSTRLRRADPVSAATKTGDLRARLTAATGLEADALDILQAQAEALRTWLRSEGYTQFDCEVPIQRREATGAEFNGVIDLLAEGDGKRLILDHKSGSGRMADYLPQLLAYREQLVRLGGDKATDIAVHWIDSATVELVLRGQ